MAGGPFSEHEQRFLLAEVLKVSSVHVASLVQFLREGDVDFNWRHVGLPAGRNLDECEFTYDSLLNHDELPPHDPNAPYTPGGSQSQSRRSYAPGGSFQQLSSTRAIKPKPNYPGANGGTPSAPYSGKKRGRPSKAELERRAQEAAAAAEEGGVGLSIGADGAVIAGQKRAREEGEAEAEGQVAGEGNTNVGDDLVQQAQGALAAAMPPAMMHGVEGQPPVKRGRGRPRKIRPEEQIHQGEHQHQAPPLYDTPEFRQQQQQEREQQQQQQHQVQELAQDQDEMVLVQQLQQDAALHADQALPEGELEQGEGQGQAQAQHVEGSPGEKEGALRFFRGLQQHGVGHGAGHGHA